MTPAAHIINRNGWIDSLRAISALAVVLFHFNSVPVPVPPAWAANVWHTACLQGHWGVIVFFVLSGYCIFSGWNRARGCGDFLWRRVTRIFPPYWGSLLLVVGLAAAVWLLTGVNDVAVLPRSASAIVANLLLLTNPLTAVPTLNWVYWTLTSLLAYYAIMGLVLLPRTGRIKFVATLHGVLCLVAIGWPAVGPGPLFFITNWPAFGAGVALAAFPEHRHTGVAMLLVSALHAAWQLAHDAVPAASLFVSAATIAALALSRNKTLPAALRPLAWVGKISYSLYLVHVPIGVYVLMRFLPPVYAGSLAYIGAQLLLLVITVCAAGLFYLVAERPVLSARPTAAP